MTEATAAPETTTDGKLVSAARKLEGGLDTAKDKLGTAKETAKEKLGTVKEKLDGALEKTKETGQIVAKKSLADMTDDVGSYVKEHPGQTVLVSFGVGAFIGWLIGRSR